jgi:succinate-semialdehyde dehydrogenase/glutarate-semialdehyde dehydrogenase
MERFVEDATARGAIVLTGGTRTDGAGFHFPPTVLRGVPDAEFLQMKRVNG